MTDKVDYEQYFTLYERSLFDQNYEKIKALESQIEKLKKNRCDLHYDKKSISDINEQRLIILYVCEKLPKKDRKFFIKQCSGMFFHADNVRCVCEHHGFEEPAWFKEKYSHLYAKK